MPRLWLLTGSTALTLAACSTTPVESRCQPPESEECSSPTEDGGAIVQGSDEAEGGAIAWDSGPVEGGALKQDAKGQSAEPDQLAPLVTDVTPPGFAASLSQTAPADFPLTEERAQLGKRLFFDPILSADHSVSCSSCHHQEHAFADPNAQSEGVQGRTGTRNASHLVNLAWVRSGLFWDGRAKTLEAQALLPIEDPTEMALPLDQALTRLSEDPSYRMQFRDAYGAPPSKESLASALASFVRTLVSVDSPYDAYVRGDQSALSPMALRGLALFFDGSSGCFHCHSENTLTNDGFFNNGTFQEGGDPGRQALTGRTGDFGKFRVPNLRNVAVTAPYMHDGSLPTLETVVDHYAGGGNGHRTTDPQIEELTLTDQDKQDLVAFLESLTDQAFLKDPRFQP